MLDNQVLPHSIVISWHGSTHAKARPPHPYWILNIISWRIAVWMLMKCGCSPPRALTQLKSKTQHCLRKMHLIFVHHNSISWQQLFENMKQNCVNIERFEIKHHAKMLHDVWTIVQNCLVDPTIVLHSIISCQDSRHLHHTQFW